MPSKKKPVTLRQLAHELGLAVDLVRNVLREAPVAVTKEVQDKVFKTARKMGYNFRKLKIGKRMQHRKECLEELVEKITEQPAWDRGEILKHLKECLGLIDRVSNRVFRDEFGK